MAEGLSVGLLVVFLIHLVVFAVLAIRRREGYYLALVVTFTLLSLSLGARLWGAELMVAGQPLASWLRWAAWLAAAVSISWGLRRFWRRRRR